MTRSVLLLVGFAAVASAAPDPATGTLRTDFRGGTIDGKLFEKIGAKEQIRVEPEGLRITLPGNNATPGETGLRAKFRLKGDFEVTASYELVSAAVPERARGVGVSVYARTDTPAGSAAMMGRFNRRDGTWYTWNLATTGADGKRTFDGRVHPSDATSGRLRMVRRGPLVTFFVADGVGESFRQLGMCELGPEDVNLLRIAAENNKSDAPLDVRFGELEVRSPATFGKDAAPIAANEPPAKSRRWLVAAEIAALLALVAAVAVWRRRRRPAAMPATDVGLSCANCGRRLWAKAESVGKRLKCPGCGQAVVVSPPPPAAPAAASGSKWVRVTVLAVVAGAVVVAGLMLGPRVVGRASSAGIGTLQAAAERVRSLETDTIDLRSAPDVADNDLAALAGLPNLKHLNLDYCPITDAGLRHVGRVPGLLSLSLTRTGITDAGLAELSGVIGLEDLRLDETAVTDAGLARLAALPHLHGLSLYRTNVGDAGLAHLAELWFLERLSLDETKVGDDGLRHLAGLRYLNELKVWNTRITRPGVEALKKALPKLRVTQL